MEPKDKLTDEDVGDVAAFIQLMLGKSGEAVVKDGVIIITPSDDDGADLDEKDGGDAIS